MTYEECAKKLREDGYNHVDSNRWGKVDKSRKITFANVVTKSGTEECEIVYRT